LLASNKVHPMSIATFNPSEWTVRYPNTSGGCAIQRQLSYATPSDQERLLDLYSPTETNDRPGIMIITSGYPSAGLKHHFHRTAREFGSARSWGELFAIRGIAAITYDAVDPTTDLPMVIECWSFAPARTLLRD
jgi:hypothetical protein